MALPRSLTRFVLAAALTAAATASSGSRAANKYLEVVAEETAEGSRAYHYANLSNEEAFAELDRRGVPYRKVTESVLGVRAPIRLSGRMHGVLIHSVLPPEQRDDTPFEMLDARLALALDDFCRILSHHDVVEVVHFTMYRPPPEKVSDPDAPQNRHPGGMAIDVGALKKKNGDWLAVGPHWPSQIGAKTCGQGARKLITRRGRELMSILCELGDQRIFHYMLSPHFNRDHHDHWHLEIKTGVKWFLYN